MPDITMCINDSCPLRKKCYRYRAVPSKYRQSFCRFEPITLSYLHHTELMCPHIWDIEKGRKVMALKDVDKRYKRSTDESDNTGD